jgi:5-aminolevulinate synthase
MSFSQVGDPSISSKISDDLILRFGHYVQAINYPTVARGKENLRVAPTPHHTEEMMDAFVRDLKIIWEEVGLELKPKKQFCPTTIAGECNYCLKPLFFDQLEARIKPCAKANCPAAAMAA